MISAQEVATFLERSDVCVKIDGFDVVIQAPNNEWSARGSEVPSVARLAMQNEQHFKAVSKINTATARAVRTLRVSRLPLEIGALVLQSKALKSGDDFVSLEILKEAGRTLRDLLEETVNLGES